MKSRVVLISVTFGLLAFVQAFGEAASSHPRGRLAQARIPFVENRGQLDRRVAFAAQTFFGGVFVTRDGKLVYSIPGERSGHAKAPRAAGWTLTETLLVGKPAPSGGNRASAGASYFLGSDSQRWRSDLPTYEDVRLGEVWRGISLGLRAHGGTVEKVFTVAPGVGTDKIRLRLDGALSIRRGRDGSLLARTANGDVRFSAPAAFQERDGKRAAIPVKYVIDGSAYGFSVGAHDPTLALVIDPLLQSTYAGGGDEEIVTSLCVSPANGDVYLAGGTGSSDFPGTSGGAQPSLANYDGFVARFDPTLTTLRQATYFGGSGVEEIRSLALNPTSGDVVAAGETGSSDLPGTTGGAQPSKGGGLDGFVVRLDSTLTSLLQATYLGGSAQEQIFGVAFHPTSGEILVAGQTQSTDLPGSSGGAQVAHGGGQDAFLARLNSSLTALLQSTYLGGTADDVAFGIAIQPSSGEVVVAGNTLSTDFPGVSGGAESSASGVVNGFIARLNSSLTTLLQSTYLDGGPIRCVAVDPSGGGILVAGVTSLLAFAGTAGGAQASPGGGGDAFITKLNPSLTTLVQSTYLGGPSSERPYALAIHPVSGELLVVGATSSGFTPGTSFPGTNGSAQPIYGGGNSDGFVARLNTALTELHQSTYLGGSGADYGFAVAVNPTSGEILVGGYTDSGDFPKANGGAQVSFAGGDYDGFVARLSADLAAANAVPEAIVLDPVASGTSDGNGLLEPGETVIVRPSWKNGGTDPVSPDGTASAFGGPSVATYAIPDASASYGSIAAGATGSCAATANCYQLSLSSAPGRPTHFDTTFKETLSTGETKTWTLHVSDSFSDVPRSHLFYGRIETLLHTGITAGCTPTAYCPSDPVSRASMGVFIAKAIAGGGSKVPVFGTIAGPPFNGADYNCVAGGISLFTDVLPTDNFCKHVHYLAAQNVTLGCAPALYCPAPSVSRGEMAIFIAKAVVAPAGGSAIPPTYGPDPVTGRSYSCSLASPNLNFTDVATSDTFCKHIHYLWAKGIVGGCNATQYCPAPQIDRGAMAKFLVNAFKLTLYGP